MKILVIGLGSMGRRRIRLLQDIDQNFKIIGIDTQVARRNRASDEFSIETVDSLDEISVESCDAAFVCTSPLSHSSIIEKCLELDLHVFTEINLVDKGYENLIDLAKEKSKILFLSSTFLYRKEIEYIHNVVSSEEMHLTYVYHTGQYLPDWHPWENYKDFFVCNKATNACREIMAIEFPWIIELFGKVKTFHVMSGKQTSLDLDYPDNYQIMFEHESGHRGIILVDVVSRKPTRNFELIGEDVYLTWDGTPYGLKVFNVVDKTEKNVYLYGEVNKRTDYSTSIIEDAYTSEIIEFFDAMHNGLTPRYSFEKDIYVLSLINDIDKTI